MDEMRAWFVLWRALWQARRDDQGGITDDTALMGILALAAVAVGFTVYWLVRRGARSINLGF